MGYDDDLVRNEPGNLAAEEEAAFEEWASTSLPNLNWDNDTEVQAAFAVWEQHLNAIADKAEAEIEKPVRIGNANLHHACARCGRKFPRMFQEQEGGPIVCKPVVCRPVKGVKP